MGFSILHLQFYIHIFVMCRLNVHSGGMDFCSRGSCISHMIAGRKFEKATF